MAQNTQKIVCKAEYIDFVSIMEIFWMEKCFATDYVYAYINNQISCSFFWYLKSPTDLHYKNVD